MKMVSLELAIVTAVSNHPERLFATVDSVHVARTERRGGVLWQVLEVRTSLVNGKAPVRAAVWVDDSTGRVVEMKGVVKKIPLPGVKAVNFTVKYEPDNEGRSLPTVVTV